MILDRFISYSLIIHLVVIALLFIAPARKENEEKPFFARLVTPREAEIKDVKIIAPKDLARLPKAPLAPSITKEPPRALFSEQAVPSQQTDKDAGAKTSDAPEDKAAPGLKMKNLFDSDVIAKSVVKQEKAQKEKSSVTFDAKEFKYYGYMQRLKEKIEGIWRYPPGAMMQGIYGDLYIRFTIKKNGSLGSVELVRTSGHRDLDEAAIRALKDAAPYWPLPDEWKQDGLTITGHFIYSLYGTYVR